MDEERIFTVGQLFSELLRLNSGRVIQIQLPDNQPPVDFTIWYDKHDPEGTVVLLPLPPEGEIWDHDTNVISSSPQTSSVGS